MYELAAKIEAAHKAAAQANKAMWDYRSMVRDLASAAADAVKSEHSAEVRRLEKAAAVAADARDAAMDEKAGHEWEGRMVFKMVAQGRAYERCPAKRVDGIVETQRTTTLVGNTPSHRLPGLGRGIVRLLKSNGKPGLRVERLEGFNGTDWSLAE